MRESSITVPLSVLSLILSIGVDFARFSWNRIVEELKKWEELSTVVAQEHNPLLNLPPQDSKRGA
jgi:hypothetical protein